MKEPHIFYQQPIHISRPSVCRSRVFCNSQRVRGVFLFAMCRRRRGLNCSLRNSNRSQNRNVKARNLGATPQVSSFTATRVFFLSNSGRAHTPRLCKRQSVKESLVLPQQNKVSGFFLYKSGSRCKQKQLNLLFNS